MGKKAGLAFTKNNEESVLSKKNAITHCGSESQSAWDSDLLCPYQRISLYTKASKMILSANPKTLRLKGLWLTPNTKTRLLNLTTPKVKLKLRICLENIPCLSLAITVGRISDLTSRI